jgi:hypothetical protein
MDEYDAFQKTIEAMFDRNKLRAQCVDGENNKLPEEIERWVEDENESPYLVLRESIFADDAIPDERPYWVDVEQPVRAPNSVRYTGPQLYRADLEVCLELWRIKRSGPGHVDVVTNWFLRSLDRAACEENRAALDDTFTALSRAVFWVRGGRSCVGTSIISSMLYEDERWSLNVSRCLAQVFAPNFSWGADGR